MVTSNHIHLLVADDWGREVIPNSMQLVAGRTGQEYNQRKGRKGAYWEDRYHATAVESGDFGENAAWWWIMILALNLNAAFKSLVLGGKWVWKRMKAIRFSLINIPARIIGRSRQLSLRLNAGDPAYGWLMSIRAKIARLLPAPSG